MISDRERISFENNDAASQLMQAISTATKLAILVSGIYIGAIAYPRLKECISGLMERRAPSAITQSAQDERIAYVRGLARSDPMQYNALLVCSTAYALSDPWRAGAK